MRSTRLAVINYDRSVRQRMSTIHCVPKNAQGLTNCSNLAKT